MDEIKELLKELNIFKSGKETEDGYYVVKLDSYEEFNSVYLALEHEVGINRDSDASFVRVDEAHIQYNKGKLIIELIGLLDDNNYTLNIFKED